MALILSEGEGLACCIAITDVYRASTNNIDSVSGSLSESLAESIGRGNR